MRELGDGDGTKLTGLNIDGKNNNTIVQRMRRQTVLGWELCTTGPRSCPGGPRTQEDCAVLQYRTILCVYSSRAEYTCRVYYYICTYSTMRRLHGRGSRAATVAVQRESRCSATHASPLWRLLIPLSYAHPELYTRVHVLCIRIRSVAKAWHYDLLYSSTSW